MRKYQSAEAFCLMEYASKDGNEVEFIWNSRDGVTPFALMSRLGTELQHVNWQRDRCLPEFRPQPGSRIFIDMSPERAREICTARVEKWWNQEPHPMSTAYATKDEAIDGMTHQFGPGTPQLIEVKP